MSPETAMAPTASGRIPRELALGLVAIAAALARLAGAFLSVFGDYSVLPLGELLVLAVFLVAFAWVLVGLWQHPERAHEPGVLMCAAAAFIFLVGAWYIVAPTVAILSVALVLGLRLSPRQPAVTASLLAVLALGIALLLFSLALTALGSLLAGVTSLPDRVSPNGMLVLKASDINPGAMASETMAISVEPRFFPVVSKSLYYGNGVWSGDLPNAYWLGNWTVRVGGRRMNVFDPSWVYGD